jgi:hypothetical protein
MNEPTEFNTLIEAVKEAHRWVREADLPVIVTLEEDGSYAFYGHGKRVYNTTADGIYGTDLDVYRRK